MHPEIILISLFFTLISGSRANESDYEALLAIKAEISDDPDSVLRSWSNSSGHFCHWEGVTCSPTHNRVTILNLSYNKLVGTLSPFVGNLSFLRVLNLSDNSFRGDIPHQISHLPRLRRLALGKNSFGGQIPANLSRCSHLEILNLRGNKLVGRVPPDLALLPNLISLILSSNNLYGSFQSISNLSTSLLVLELDQNRFQGSIPDDIGRLGSLVFLALGDNQLSGTIPPSLFNLSSLQSLHLSNSGIRGHLPQDLGLRLPQLSGLAISNTSLSGRVPASLSNLSSLYALDISQNSFTGSFSLDGSNMPNLFYLNIGLAFSSEEAKDIGFLDTLTNCTILSTLVIRGNAFTGVFPRSILNFSTSLRFLDFQDNHISGQLPLGLGRFVNLNYLILDSNNFTGPIPSDIGSLKSAGLLSFMNNNFSKEIPSSFRNLTVLAYLFMSRNNLEGSLSESVGDWRYLQELDVSRNKLSGVLPAELFRAPNLNRLVVSQNNLQGNLPAEIGRMKNLEILDVSRNRFSGEIPSALGGCTSLVSLNMSGNSFVGSIPESLRPLGSFKFKTLDLSYNNLSGPIPSYFSKWPYLSSLNLSFNSFEGEVPITGVFKNTSVVSVVGNGKLCGGVPELHLPRCPQHKESKRRKLSLGVIMSISIASVLIVVMSIALCFYWFYSSRKQENTRIESPNKTPFFEVSYQMLSSATEGFSPRCLLGVGGFGSVYKGTLRRDEKEVVVAVKVLNLQNKGANKSFNAECNALREIRHRNLCKIITVCSSIDAQRNDFKALVYEFMPMGSLDGWLHSSNLVSNENVDDNLSCSLSIFQRLSIAIDVASALEYLHVRCPTPIIHCDLKPSNILLDNEMTAHVGDFGLAKILSLASASNTTNDTSSTQVRGTVGYAAPEYGLGSKASVEGDIYSFGIVVLEMITSKKPTDPMFSKGLNLHEFAKSAFPNRVMEIIDQRMLVGDANALRAITSDDVKEIECIKSLIKVGVQCTLDLPRDRMSIIDVVNELKCARQNGFPTLKRTYNPM